MNRSGGASRPHKEREKRMKKKYFAAKAVLVNNEGREFEVTIYSMYESIEEAEQGIERFLTHGFNVKMVWIES